MRFQVGCKAKAEKKLCGLNVECIRTISTDKYYHYYSLFCYIDEDNHSEGPVTLKEMRAEIDLETTFLLLLRMIGVY